MLDSLTRSAARPTPAFEPFDRSALDHTIIQRFDRQADRFADRIAVSASNVTLTYRELAALSRRVAGALSRPTAASPTVLVLMEQSAALLAGILGTLRAGRAYVPVESRYPDAQLRDIAAFAEVTAVVTDAANLARASALFRNLYIVNVDDLGDETSEDVPPHSSPGSLAYLYFTSGSTGRPKAVMDSHRNVLHNVMRYTNALRINPFDRLTLLQTPGFSGAVSSMFCALLNGAQSCPLDLRACGLGRAFADWVRDREITIFHSTPAIFRMLTSTGRTFPSVRIVRLEGDAASGLDAERFRQCCAADATLANGLGATETGLSAQYFVDVDSLADGPLPIGYPTEDMEIELIGPDGRAVACGAAGEIVVKSEFLALGYWNDPERTRLAFSTEPDGRRAYRTGDMARRAPDGCITHLGRVDSQLKVGGQRIDIDGIESALTRVAGVREAVVTIVAGQDGDAQIVAYLTMDGPLASVAALRSAVSARLDASMVPSSFVRLDALPLSENGKVDRRLLPFQENAVILRDESGHRPPRTAMEQRVAAVWSEILGVKPVGLSDDFFLLGGDSIKAARVCNALERSVGSVPLSALFETPTLEVFARTLEQGVVKSPLVALRRAGSRPPLFLFHAHDGHATIFADLTKHLTSDQPVYAFQATAIADSAAAPDNDLGVMVERYLTEIRRVQPEGPYRLAGTCLGGVLAFEAAQRLHVQGQACSAVVLIAVSPPDFARLLPRTFRARSRVSRLFETMGLQRRRLAERPPRRWPGYLRYETRMAFRRRRQASDDPIVRAHAAACRGYQPQPYAGSVSLILPSAARLFCPDLGGDWQGISTRPVDVRLVAATAIEFLRPPAVETLAAHLDDILGDANVDWAVSGSR